MILITLYIILVWNITAPLNAEHAHYPSNVAGVENNNLTYDVMDSPLAQWSAYKQQ